jgi:uncharacterized protein (TIGR00369 family)
VRASHTTIEEVQAAMSMDGFGYGQSLGIRVTAIDHGEIRAEMQIRDEFLRPGGTVAGPILMGLADAAMWGAAMTSHPDGIQSVTSDMTVHFLSRPAGKLLKCVASVIKPGKRLIVLRADLTCDDDPRVVAACQSTYAVPAKPIIA